MIPPRPRNRFLLPKFMQPPRPKRALQRPKFADRLAGVFAHISPYPVDTFPRDCLITMAAPTSATVAKPNH